MRHFSLLDNVLSEIDTVLRTLITPQNRPSTRPSPSENKPCVSLTESQKKHIAGLMRVNHSGEVCAQALYQGQALTAKLEHIRTQMAQAADEEVDHLAWCELRLHELGSQPSVLNPLWYSSSLLLGMLAGLAGDQWSLGFVAETERQVTAHLQNHLERLPKDDEKTAAILEQMKQDETEHAQTAVHAGAAELPWPIKTAMKHVSKVMTKIAYHV